MNTFEPTAVKLLESEKLGTIQQANVELFWQDYVIMLITLSIFLNLFLFSVGFKSAHSTCIFDDDYDLRVTNSIVLRGYISVILEL